MKKGFTLLELLIVVIIVGILAGIALPQFFRAAERARASEGVNALGVIRSSLLRYYSERGALTANLNDLDVEMPTFKYFNAPTLAAVVLYTGGAANMASIVRNAVNAGAYSGYTLTIQQNGTITCTAGVGGRCPSGF
ncbi:MAG: prepilin-type N-terminal cleavage/methylation domain-containing protein [Candidatus Omnitrophica bacterium]|nr:prepilin-type N-terminal cleavage/methylation domain-containing protein [Candidatus Omnitrophota bacterium]MCM8826018.1 prepilin-type N-terminal cleavage/methylation domain-containing protein [Candidatus Omnitrophota bacterium]